MRVLVTGGAGFIGSNLVHALVGEHTVGVIDDLSTGKPENIHPASWFRSTDILDQRFAEQVVEFAPEAVVHLAAQSSVSASLANPERDWAVNVEGTRAVIRAGIAAGARLVLSASSAAVYGEPAEIPLKENARKLPTSPYGRSKLAAEEVLASESCGGHVDFASFRFANVYGPRQDAQGEGGVVAAFCSRMAVGESPIIHGTGMQTRDFVYVGDVVGAILAGLGTDVVLREGEGSGPAYNISTGVRTTVEAIGTILRPVSGFTGAFQYDAPRESDILDSALDSTKAFKVFGWDSRVALESGLAMTYRWFSSQ